jgi:hypothetical protein
MQRHHFSEKQRFDSQRFENPQQAVGMAAAPGDTGGGEPELLATAVLGWLLFCQGGLCAYMPVPK